MDKSTSITNRVNNKVPGI